MLRTFVLYIYLYHFLFFLSWLIFGGSFCERGTSDREAYERKNALDRAKTRVAWSVQSIRIIIVSRTKGKKHETESLVIGRLWSRIPRQWPVSAEFHPFRNIPYSFLYSTRFLHFATRIKFNSNESFNENKFEIKYTFLWNNSWIFAQRDSSESATARIGGIRSRQWASFCSIDFEDSWMRLAWAR